MCRILFYYSYITILYCTDILQSIASESRIWHFLTKYIVCLFFENLRARNSKNFIRDINNNKNVLIYKPIVIII